MTNLISLNAKFKLLNGHEDGLRCCKTFSQQARDKGADRPDKAWPSFCMNCQKYRKKDGHLKGICKAHRHHPGMPKS